MRLRSQAAHLRVPLLLLRLLQALGLALRTLRVPPRRRRLCDALAVQGPQQVAALRKALRQLLLGQLGALRLALGLQRGSGRREGA